MKEDSGDRGRGEPPSRGPRTKSTPTPAPRRSKPFSVRNLQRSYRINSRALKTFINEVAVEMRPDCPPGAVVLVRDPRIRELNLRFRGKDKATDVLSFPTADTDVFQVEPYLGDIVISVETASRQAARRRYPLERELRLLSIHGFLHLLGYDHVTDDGDMRRIEYRLRRRFGLTGSGNSTKAVRLRRRHA